MSTSPDLVDVFRSVHRVLRDDGTVWLVIGDKNIDGELQLVPARVALTLRADGWLLRSDIVWHKPQRSARGGQAPPRDRAMNTSPVRRRGTAIASTWMRS